MPATKEVTNHNPYPDQLRLMLKIHSNISLIFAGTTRSACGL
ncbi:MAG: hypothetical protein ACK4RF_08510 [Cyclobacteriaceae bacterium]